MKFVSVVRITFAAIVTLSALGACADSTAPRVQPHPPAPGVYVLRTLNGASLPNDGVYPAVVTVAETLIVANDESYTVAGAYYARYMLTTYRITPRQTFQFSGDTVIAPTLNQGGDGIGSFGAAVVTTRGDTLTATYTHIGGSSIAVFTRVASPTLPGPAASLLLWNADTLLVQGATLDVQALVRRGLDANGLWIVRPPPTVSVTAPPGWTLSGSTLTAPATGESEATIAVTSGQASTPLTVRSVIDLRTRKWQLSYACLSGPNKVTYYPPSVFRDSLIVSGPVTSVTYYHPVESVPSPRYDANLVMDATLMEYLSDGEVVTSRVSSWGVKVQRQAPDSLIYPPAPVPYGAPTPPPTVGMVTQASPRVYTGGDACDKNIYANSRPVVLTEIP